MELYENLMSKSFSSFNGRTILKESTEYQELEILETFEFGKVLSLDNKLITGERNSFFYQEAMVHPAAFTVSKPKNALIIGGGDGGLAKQLLKHESIAKIVIAELDKRVIDISKEYLKDIHENSLDSNRVEIVICNPMQYIEKTKEQFDLILLDMKDVNSPVKHLYDKNCLEKTSKILTKNGCLVISLSESIYFESTHEKIKETIENISDIYRRVSFYGCYVPLYGNYCPMVIASHGVEAKKLTEAAIKRKMGDSFKDLKYYNHKVHTGMFCLPNFYLDLLH